VSGKKGDGGLPIWLIALLAYSALALPSALLLVAALLAGAASDASTSASPTVQHLPRPLEPTPVEQV
jgi:hypothetical protein